MTDPIDTIIGAGGVGMGPAKPRAIKLDRSDIVSLKSVRNIADLHVLAVDQLNTYDVLCADDVVFTKAAFDVFVAPAQEDTK